MADVKTYDMTGKETGTMTLDDGIFGVKVNEHLIHMAVLQYLANNRQGTQKAKTRFRRRKKALETERHGSRKTGLDKVAPVEARRSRLRSCTERLQLQDE